MLTVSHLTKHYGTFPAVEDLSFTAEKGKIYGLLGPNGAGKSTTMNMITGYLAPGSGSVTIDGIDLLKEPEEAKKQIGYLPEQPPVYPDMTVEEYLSFAARLKKLSAPVRKRSIEEAMERTDIAKVRHRLIRNLSKGFKQRVGFAQAILGDAKLLIFDEPTVGLDPQQIVEIRELIRSLSGERTVILSSHILQEVSFVCDHIMVLSHGRLVASDTTEHLSVSAGAKAQLVVSARESADVMKTLLSGIEGAGNAQELPESEAGVTTLSLDVSEGVDLREEVFRAFAGAGKTLLELSLKRETLEDTYLRLTGEREETAAGEGEAEPPDAPGGPEETLRTGPEEAEITEGKEE